MPTQEPPEAEAAALAEYVPEELHEVYSNYSSFATLGPNPYASWTPPKPPYKFCLSETFLGNSWRQGMLSGLEGIVADLQEQGLASGPLTVLNANGNITVQASQINQLVNDGCNVIWSLPAGPTGICDSVASAREKGVLFITIDDPVDCPDALNVTFTETLGAQTTATWLVHALQGSGKVLMLTGIPGLKLESARQAAAEAVFAQAPGIEVVGKVQGDYSATTAKSAILKYLASHPGQIDGVWDSGAMAVAAVQAFEQSGRPIPTIVNFAGDCAFVSAWKDADLESFSVAQGPLTAATEAWQVTERLLNGESPRANLLLYPLPQITQAERDSLVPAGVTENSTCFVEPPGNEAVPDDFFDPMFES